MSNRHEDAKAIEAVVIAVALTALYQLALPPALPLFFILAHLLGAARRVEP